MKNTIMNITKNKLVIALASWYMIGVVACTDKFDEYNTDKTGFTSQQLAVDGNLVGAYFPKIYSDISMNYSYQLNNNLIGDCYAGYLTPTQNFARDIQTNMNYVMVNGWNEAVWTTAYDGMTNAAKVIELADENKLPQFAAVAKILRVMIMHRTTDTWGPIIYSKFGQSKTSSAYDSQKDVYDAFFKELTESTQELAAYLATGKDGSTFKNFDFIYDGDFKKWMKFSNSLRLRLAMRISYADPAKAKTEAEAAINAPEGVILLNDDNFKISKQTNWLNTIANDWNDVRMGAMMESYLVGYNDPRIDKMFKKSTDKKVGMDGNYKGIRNGIIITTKTDYMGFSNLNFVDPTKPMYFMTAAEMHFLKAEGVLRGWNMGGGTTKDHYEKGVSVSMEFWGAPMGTYLANDVASPSPYRDPYNSANDFPTPPTSIKIKWNDAASFEEKLERIITQKWIAVFPEGQNAWAEFRRTGYPKMMPVVKNGDEANVPTNKFIRRITYPLREQNSNTAEYNKAVGLLGGPDNPGTKVWWDKKP